MIYYYAPPVGMGILSQVYLLSHPMFDLAHSEYLGRWRRRQHRTEVPWKSCAAKNSSIQDLPLKNLLPININTLHRWGAAEQSVRALVPWSWDGPSLGGRRDLRPPWISSASRELRFEQRKTV